MEQFYIHLQAVEYVSWYQVIPQFTQAQILNSGTGQDQAISDSYDRCSEKSAVRAPVEVKKSFCYLLLPPHAPWEQQLCLTFTVTTLVTNYRVNSQDGREVEEEVSQ